MKFMVIVANTWEIVADDFATELDARFHLWDIDFGQFDALGGLIVAEYLG